jgi:hypothetical protein
VGAFAIASLLLLLVTQIRGFRRAESARAKQAEGLASLLLRFLEQNEGTLNKGISLQSMRVVYDTESDAVERTMVFSSERRHPSLLIQHCSVGGQGAGVGSVGSFNELNVRVAANGDTPLVIGEVTGGGLYQSFLIADVVPALATRSIRVTHSWPGLWNPLRATAADSGVFTLRSPVARLTLRFVGGVHREKLALRNREPDVGTIDERTDERGRQVVTWEIVDAAPGSYRYEVVTTT